MKLLITIMTLTLSFNLLACSIFVDQSKQQNEMLSAVANQYNISLVRATKLKVNNYHDMTVGHDPSTLCPIDLVVEGKVTINYKPRLTEKCQLSVNVKKTEKVLVLAVPNYEFNFPTSSCTYSPPVVRFPTRRRIRSI